MNAWKTLFEAAEHLQVPLHRKLGVEPANDVKLGDLVAPLLGRVSVDLVMAHLPGMILAGERREATELAVVGIDADVSRVDVPIDVVEGDVAVEAPTHAVGKATEMEKMRRRQAEKGIFFVQTHSVANLCCQVLEGSREPFGLDGPAHLNWRFKLGEAERQYINGPHPPPGFRGVGA